MTDKSKRLTAKFSDDPELIFPDEPRLSGTTRQRFVFEHRHVERGSLPTHVLQEHCLMLPFGDVATPFSGRLNGRVVRGLIEPGRVQFRAAGDSISTAWERRVDAIFFALRPDELGRLMGEDLDSSVDLVTDLAPRDNSTLAQLTLTLQAYLGNGNGNGNGNGGGSGLLFEQSLLTAIAAQLTQAYGRGKRPRPDAVPLSRRALATLEEYVRQNLAHELSIDAIARVVGLSPYYLCRRFRLATGRTLWQYVLECRVFEARRLIIKQRSASLAHVARACGFGSYGQFIAAFRKVFGQTPGDFRHSRG